MTANKYFLRIAFFVYALLSAFQVRAEIPPIPLDKCSTDELRAYYVFQYYDAEHEKSQATIFYLNELTKFMDAHKSVDPSKPMIDQLNKADRDRFNELIQKNRSLEIHSQLNQRHLRDQLTVLRLFEFINKVEDGTLKQFTPADQTAAGMIKTLTDLYDPKNNGHMDKPIYPSSYPNFCNVYTLLVQHVNEMRSAISGSEAQLSKDIESFKFLSNKIPPGQDSINVLTSSERIEFQRTKEQVRKLSTYLEYYGIVQNLMALHYALDTITESYLRDWELFLGDASKMGFTLDERISKKEIDPSVRKFLYFRNFLNEAVPVEPFVRFLSSGEIFVEADKKTSALY